MKLQAVKNNQAMGNIRHLIADLEAPVELPEANAGANIGGFICLGALILGIIFG